MSKIRAVKPQGKCTKATTYCADKGVIKWGTSTQGLPVIVYVLINFVLTSPNLFHQPPLYRPPLCLPACCRSANRPPHINCRMTKLKQFSNKFGVHYSRENNPWIGRVKCLRSRRRRFLKDLSKMSSVSLRGSKAKTGHDWLGGQGFPYKASRSYFLGSGKLAIAELEDCDWYLLGFLDSEAFSVSSG